MSIKLDNNFYQNIAKLFYAIAFVDRSINEKEHSVFKEMVQNKWFHLDNNTDATTQIKLVFDNLKAEKIDAYTCYDEFIEYNNEHPYYFTKPINSLIMKTAEKIVSSYASKNKSELIMLAKLNLHLKNYLL
jgi:hypothetical protein